MDGRPAVAVRRCPLPIRRIERGAELIDIGAQLPDARQRCRPHRDRPPPCCWSAMTSTSCRRARAEMLLKSSRQSQYFETLLKSDNAAVREACLKLLLPGSQHRNPPHHLAHARQPDDDRPPAQERHGRAHQRRRLSAGESRQEHPAEHRQPSGMLDAYAWVRRVRDTEGASVFMAHDPDGFKAQKHSPDFYE